MLNLHVGNSQGRRAGCMMATGTRGWDDTEKATTGRANFRTIGIHALLVQKRLTVQCTLTPEREYLRLTPAPALAPAREGKVV